MWCESRIHKGGTKSAQATTTMRTCASAQATTTMRSSATTTATTAPATTAATTTAQSGQNDESSWHGSLFWNDSFICNSAGRVYSVHSYGSLPKNKNVKNFSRAMLIWLAIGIIFSGISVAVISKKVIDTANKVTQCIKTIDTVSDVLNEVSGLLNQDGSGEVEESLEQFGIGELGDTLEQFDNGELEDTLEQLENGEWEEIFNQLENGGMEDILNSFGSGEFILE